jgi:hypothetical protein
MIVHDPNLVRLAIDPFENHAPLIVDPDRVEFLAIALTGYRYAVKLLAGVARTKRNDIAEQRRGGGGALYRRPVLMM